MTNGYKFSVRESDVDNVINRFLPVSFKASVTDLRRQARDYNNSTACLSFTSMGHVHHVRFGAPNRGRPVMHIAVEYIRNRAATSELRSLIDEAVRDYGAVDGQILDTKKHATEQIL